MLLIFKNSSNNSAWFKHQECSSYFIHMQKSIEQHCWTKACFKLKPLKGPLCGKHVSRMCHKKAVRDVNENHAGRATYKSLPLQVGRLWNREFAPNKSEYDTPSSAKRGKQRPPKDCLKSLKKHSFLDA